MLLFEVGHTKKHAFPYFLYKHLTSPYFTAPDNDDEDFERTEIPKLGAAADKNTGLKEEQTTMIVIIVAAVALALSVAVIVAIVLVKRHKYNRQQGIYSVPTEQDQKGAV
ncbi:hypothetical protein EPR50_G00066220 [Perca flavescens]|uniref:Uncharacterized protein n=1 Tax=Perca flavescens TaxID=8167 RepID=A0A484D8V2_PERFV|nr:hypothetical protein EPR50_G00066220 [Perca flavescens]